ncbi:MAG: type II toxin-antitoxin system VapC family toxin [Pyrobaculum sp.]
MALLDTSYLIQKLDWEEDFSDVYHHKISIVTLYEYLVGRRRPKELKTALESILEVVPLTNEIILTAVDVKKRLKSSGLDVPEPDVFIAATALVVGEELWTYDSDFLKIKNVAPLEVRLFTR